MSQKIRIKLKSYDHKLVDKSAEKIVKAVIPFPPTSVSTPLTALPSLTRRLVSSSSCQTTSV